MKTILAGFATKDGENGADWWIHRKKNLPDYYITRNQAKILGWIKKEGNLADVAPGRMIFGGVYRNRDGHLPNIIGRIWYEADINYKNGFRNDDRFLYSNDGLTFVTYDHYKTFIEII